MEDEDEFPLGDETADSAADVICPYCGEGVQISLDPGGGTTQEYVEDCPVCCRPWRVYVNFNEDGGANVSLDSEDESG